MLYERPMHDDGVGRPGMAGQLTRVLFLQPHHTQRGTPESNDRTVLILDWESIGGGEDVPICITCLQDGTVRPTNPLYTDKLSLHFIFRNPPLQSCLSSSSLLLLSVVSSRLNLDVPPVLTSGQPARVIYQD